MAEPNVMPVAEAAARLGVTPGRVRQLLDSGELGCIPFAGRLRLVTESSLRRLIAEREAQKAQVTNSSSSSKTKAGK